jgi:hypothetical protein
VLHRAACTSIVSESCEHDSIRARAYQVRQALACARALPMCHACQARHPLKVCQHAGKSTTINILTGVLPPSGGDAILGGESIRSPGGLAAIQSNMGVCPQFDVLWNELTGHEHMIIFGARLLHTGTLSAQGTALQRACMQQVRAQDVVCRCCQHWLIVKGGMHAGNMKGLRDRKTVHSEADRLLKQV